MATGSRMPPMRDLSTGKAQPMSIRKDVYKSYFMCTKCQYNSLLPASSDYCHSCSDKVCMKCKTRHGTKTRSATTHTTVKLQCAKCMTNQETTIASVLCTDCQCYLCADCASSHKELCNVPSRLVPENTDRLIVHADNDSKAHNDLDDVDTSMNLHYNGSDKLVGTEPVPKYGTHIGEACKKNRQRRQERLKFAQLSSEFDPSVIRDKYASEISHLLFLPNSNLLLVDSNNKKLKMFTIALKVKCVSVLKMVSDVWNMCLSNKYPDEVYISFLNGKTIAVIDIESRLRIHRTIEPEVTCRGVTCWHSGIAVVAVVPRAASVEGQHELLLMDYNGAVKHRITRDKMNTSHYLTPHHLTSIRSGNEIVISHYGEHAITFYDVVNVCGKAECDREGLAWPGAMTTDEDNNVYVIAGEFGHENIHQLSADGKYMGVVLRGKDGLMLKGLAYDKTTQTMAVQLCNKNTRKPGNIGIFNLS